MPGVYRIDIQQGNVITQEQLAALERGMEKRKVRFILGTPLVVDTFNQDRWDYYYSIEKLREDRMQRIVSVFFEDERLVRVGGDVLAALGPIEVEKRRDEVVTVPDGYRDQGLFASLTPGFLSDRPKPAEESEDAPQTAASESSQPESESGPLTIDEDDERYLRDVLAGFGRVDAVTRPAPTGPIAAEPEAAPVDSREEEEGVLSRWAKRLGLDEPAPPAEPPAQ